MTGPMPQTINDARRNLRARLGKRVSPRPDAGPPLTTEEAELAARLKAHFAGTARRDEDGWSEPPELAALTPPPVPWPPSAAPVAPVPVENEITLRSLRWRDAARRARWHDLPRTLAAWTVTAAIIVAVLATATVALIGFERSTSIAYALRDQASHRVAVLRQTLHLR